LKTIKPKDIEIRRFRFQVSSFRFFISVPRLHQRNEQIIMPPVATGANRVDWVKIQSIDRNDVARRSEDFLVFGGALAKAQV